MSTKPKWIVQSGCDEKSFLEDSGCLVVDKAKGPYGGPGYFGPRDRAFVFKTKKDALKASSGLLGVHGRSPKVVKVLNQKDQIKKLQVQIDQLKNKLNLVAAAVFGTNVGSP